MRLPVALLLLTPALACAQATPNYEDHVAPIFEEACTFCHDASDPGGGLNLADYGSLMRGGASGDVIAPGDAEGSKLFRQVTRQERPFMPRGGDPLSKQQVATLRAWIDAGALETKSSQPRTKARGPALKVDAPSSKAQAVLPRALSLQPHATGSRPPAAVAVAGAPVANLVGVAGHQQVLLYKADRGQLLGVLPFPAGRVHALGFSRDGARVFAAGGHPAKRGALRLWDLASARVLFELEDGHDAFLAADVRSDLRQVAAGGPTKTVRTYDTRDGARERELKGHTDWVTALAYSPDGVLLASGDRAGGLHVWESLSGGEYLELQRHPKGVTAVAWRADSNVLVTACEDGNLRLFQLQDGKLLKTIKAHADGALDVAFFPDGRLASAGRDRRFKTWKPGGQLERDLGKSEDLALSVTVVAGSTVAGGDWKGRIRTWAADGTLRGTWDPNPPDLSGMVGEGIHMQQAASATRDERAEQLKAATATREAAEARLKDATAAAESARKAASETPAAEVLGAELQATLRAAVDVAKRRVAHERASKGDGLKPAEGVLSDLRSQLQRAEQELAAQRAASAPRKAKLAEAAKRTAAALASAQEAATKARTQHETAAKAEAHAAYVLKRANGYLDRWRAELAIGDVYAARDVADRARREALTASLSASDALAQVQARQASARDALAKARKRLDATRQQAQLNTGFLKDAVALEQQLLASLKAARKLSGDAAKRLQLTPPQQRATLERARQTVKNLEGLLAETRQSLQQARARSAELERSVAEHVEAEATAKAALAPCDAAVKRAREQQAAADAAAHDAQESATKAEQTLESARQRLLELRKQTP